MRLRFLLFFGLLSFLLVVTVNGEKNTDDENVEGSANVQNPDDEDFEEEEASGLPPDDDDKKEEQVKDIKENRDYLPPKPTQPPIHPTTVILKPGKVQDWSFDSSTIAILLGVLFLVVFIIIIAIIICRKRSRKSEYTRGTRQSNAYV